MKLYRLKIPEIAHAIIDRLCTDGDIEVTMENRDESEQDLISIMEEFLRRDWDLREKVRENMSNGGIGYEQYGKIRGQMAEEWHHPTGDDVERFMARQFIENFMISRFVEEVYTEDGQLWRKTLRLITDHDVDERELRDEAREQIKNVTEGTVEYEMAFQQSLRSVKKRRGLI